MLKRLKALACTAALACLGAAPAVAQGVLVMAVWGGGGANTWREAFIKQFTPTGGYTVKMVEVPNPAGALRSPAAANQYNLALVTYFEAIALSNAGLIESFDDKQLPGIADVDTKFLTKDKAGRHVGLPVYFTYYGIAFNTDLAKAAEGYGLSFVHFPVTAETKGAVEAKQLALMRERGVELIVLARYMQVLSADFLEKFGAPVINIHHSFLPAFAGGRPYHQAHARGVKLIGATAHYATRDLDEGPIIHQDVARVTHRHGVEDLVRRGRDLEKSVLAQAVRWHLDGRVLVYGNKTVVFD